MASPLSDEKNPAPEAGAKLAGLFADLQEAARRGNWQKASELADALARRETPVMRDELGAWLEALRETLIVAKTSRAHLAAELARLNAAAGFNHTRSGYSPPRQEFGETADF